MVISNVLNHSIITMPKLKKQVQSDKNCWKIEKNHSMTGMFVYS